MRYITFVSFIESYLKDISGEDTLSIHKLSNLSKRNNRVISPIILYCVFLNKVSLFYKYFDIDKYKDVSSITINNYLDDRFDKYDFKKIHTSYIRKINIYSYDGQTKLMIRENIIKMMKEKGITNYRVYTDLKLNPGNINSYLSRGNSNKVSIDTAKKIYAYCSR